MSVSIDNITEKIFDNFKKITPALVAVAVLAGLILFLPKKFLKRMSLDDLPILWNRIIGIVFLLCVALIITMILFSIISRITEKQRNKRIRDNLKKKLQTLSPRQKEIVLQLMQSEDKAIMLDKNSGDAIYLQNNLFLHMPEQAVTLGWNNEIMVKFVPQLWLLDLYNEEPELFS